MPVRSVLGTMSDRFMDFFLYPLESAEKTSRLSPVGATARPPPISHIAYFEAAYPSTPALLDELETGGVIEVERKLFAEALKRGIADNSQYLQALKQARFLEAQLCAIRQLGEKHDLLPMADPRRFGAGTSGATEGPKSEQSVPPFSREQLRAMDELGERHDSVFETDHLVQGEHGNGNDPNNTGAGAGTTMPRFMKRQSARLKMARFFGPPESAKP